MIIKKKQLLIDAPCIVGRKEKRESDDPRFDPNVAKKIVEEAEAKANEILRQAQAEASKILNEAKEKQQKMLQEIELERQQFKKRLSESAQRLAVLVSNFQRQFEQKKDEIFEEMLTVLRILIEKIAFRAIDETDFREKMKKVFAKLSEVRNARVMLSEQDMKDFPEIVEQCKALGFDVVKSSSLKPGEVLVETDIGVLDGTARTATNLIEKLIEEVFGPAGTEGVSQTVQGETERS
ncbi:MAG: FliH/SctL family protein [Thermotoga caldifontis]|uniref:FliH/SctL family protein n=1 Tax=Thermotoga caldifontis TaxID=1508419 RepID=UPI003C7D7EDF